MLSHTPFQWLQDLERRAKQKGRSLPRPDKVQQIWRGIAFRVAENPLVTPIHDIREVLNYPSPLAKVPGAKLWIKGLANIRGLLLPIIDLRACLEGTPIGIAKRSRILIISQEGITAGLVIDEVLGIKHFPEQLRDLDTPCKQSWLTPFANGLFTYEGISWTVFNMHALAKNEIFLRADY